MHFSNYLVTLALTVMSRRVWSLYTFSIRVTCKYLYIFGPVSTLLEYYKCCCRFVVLNSKKTVSCDFIHIWLRIWTLMLYVYRVRWAVFTTADQVRKVSTSLRRIRYTRWTGTNIGFSLWWIWILLSLGVTIWRLVEVFQSLRGTCVSCLVTPVPWNWLSLKSF